MFLGPTGQGAVQAGSLIVDAAGEPVWFGSVPAGSWTSNFRVQRYRGKPVLTWWQGQVVPPGYGHGHGVILDSSYLQVALIRAGHGRQADLHEFVLTPQGTALVSCFPPTVPVDLSAVGGPTNGQVLESVIQEIDIHTGRVLFEWRSLDHVGVDESYLPMGLPYDYFHVNSIEVMPDGHLLVSARHTCALYKLHRRTGRVIWRLGGARSSFRMGRRARFYWQHDARYVPGGTITLFDDGAGPVRTEAESRGLVLNVDRRRRRVWVARAYRHPSPLLAYAMGNMQPLASGNVMVGWGTLSGLSEFAPDGHLIADIWLPSGLDSYRGYRCPWNGTPARPPDVVAHTSNGSTTLYVSWNGATNVAQWQVNPGKAAAGTSPISRVARTGFETAIPLGAASGYAVVTALDSAGRPLASSKPVAL